MNFHGKGAIYPQRTDDDYIYEKERLFFILQWSHGHH